MRYLRTSRKSLYALIEAGTLRTLSQGKRRYVPGSEIARLSVLPDEGSIAARLGAIERSPLDVHLAPICGCGTSTARNRDGQA